MEGKVNHGKKRGSIYLTLGGRRSCSSSVCEHLVGLLVHKGAANLCAYSAVLICVLQHMPRPVSLLIKTLQ